MWYLYLDESGDLGFDFVNKKPSKFFTITILAIESIESNRKLIRSIKSVLRIKLNPKNKRKRLVYELKGTGTTLEIKKYFYKKVENINFGIYSMSLNKRRIYESLVKEKSKVYNFIARQVLDHIPFDKNNNDRVYLIIDKSKSKPEIEEFNLYIRNQLEGRLSPKTSLDMHHLESHKAPGLQAVDMFCWGIFQKYERNKVDWFKEFKDKVRFCDVYLPENKKPLSGERTL